MSNWGLLVPPFRLVKSFREFWEKRRPRSDVGDLGESFKKICSLERNTVESGAIHSSARPATMYQRYKFR